VSEPIIFREAMIRYGEATVTLPGSLTGPEQVAELVRRVVSTDPREHFIALYLDARHKPIAYQVVSIGTANSALVHPREVFRVAILAGAIAVVVAHNHPSGDPSPSPEDREISKRLAEAGTLIGIELLDSVVVAETAYRSLRDENPELFKA
jgi:DNA repair protein RadC